MRLLLGILTLCFLGAAGVDPVVGVRQDDEGNVLKAIRDVGGDYVRDEKSSGKPVVSVRLNGPNATNSLVRRLSVLESLHKLDLSQSMITDEGVKHLPKLKSLRDLNLSLTRVSDEGLKAISGIEQLRTLKINGTKVSDRGLKHLALLGELRSLWVGVDEISDAGLAQLAKLPQLELLWLAGTRVSDAGLRDIAALGRLQHLYVGQTGITDAGLKELWPTANVLQHNRLWTYEKPWGVLHNRIHRQCRRTYAVGHSTSS